MINKCDHEIVEQHKKKEMKKICRKALTALSNLNLKILTLSVSAEIGKEITLRITTYEQDGTNCTLDFYSFYEIERIKKMLTGFVLAAKKDDFAIVKSYVDGCRF